jgi:hypothetical protein
MISDNFCVKPAIFTPFIEDSIVDVIPWDDQPGSTLKYGKMAAAYQLSSEYVSSTRLASCLLCSTNRKFQSQTLD